MSKEFIEAFLPLVPNIVVAIAKTLAKKLAEVGGVTPAEQAAIDFLNYLEAFLNAQKA